MTKRNLDERLIESDAFPFEFLSQIAERESWRKEIHRPIYHVHKWWAKRLGSIFRGLLLGVSVSDTGDLRKAFYEPHNFTDITVFDPFMGSGTTVGEAHKLGFTALGRDINPVAVDAVRVALGPLERKTVANAYATLACSVGEKIRNLYRSKDSHGFPCDVLYYFWVMRAACPQCVHAVDLFSSYVIAQNAYPSRKPEVRIVCPSCGDIFQATHGQEEVRCPSCLQRFDAARGPAEGQKAVCLACKNRSFSINQAISRQGKRPDFRLFAKLVLSKNGRKEYLRATADDLSAFQVASDLLKDEVRRGSILLPDLALEPGYNTSQAMTYQFLNWRDFFNDRQLLALGWLRAAIARLPDPSTRGPMMTLFSGLLEFNNLFTSYKGEGTGAVRHMFSHHILKPERTPIEANVWGTSKSSGSFSGLYKGRLLRALSYRENPTEVNVRNGTKGRVCSAPFTGEVKEWPEQGGFATRSVYLSCGDSARTNLPDQSVDFIITDPPFFDNVHYSQLADFFHAWQQIGHETGPRSTRHPAEVQDTDVTGFTQKLCNVFRECHRLLKQAGLLVFTYHHSREEGWNAIAQAVLGADFRVVNSHPVKSEMSVAVPKLAAKDPIQLDIVIVCRKGHQEPPPPSAQVLGSALGKIQRLESAGFTLSRNDRKIVLFGQLLTTIRSLQEVQRVAGLVEAELAKLMKQQTRSNQPDPSPEHSIQYELTFKPTQ